MHGLASSERVGIKYTGWHQVRVLSLSLRVGINYKVCEFVSVARIGIKSASSYQVCELASSACGHNCVGASRKRVGIKCMRELA